MKKVFIGAGAIIVIIISGVFIYLKSFVPDYTGELKVPGLTQPVTIERNRFGVPTITAQNREDLYLAWGYVNAQDRMFQLETTRRIAQGRISEFAGESALKKDLFLRAMKFYEIAQREIKRVDPRFRTYLEQYVKGINYYLDTEGPNLYMKLLGLKKETWQPEDAVAVVMMLNWSLAYNLKHELLYYKMAQKVGMDGLRELMNYVPEYTPTIVKDMAAFKGENKAFYALLKDMDWLAGCFSASNNWVVGDSRTAHKGTLFASDMQVHSNRLPNDFYIIRARAGDFECTGAQVMGVPTIVSGFNKSFAWGQTNNGADMVDLYRESINWNKKTYRFKGREYPLDSKKVVITIKGKGPVEKTIYYVKGRPILSEVYDLGIDISADWAAFDSLKFHGFFEINEARNFNEFKKASGNIRLSPQNCVYADRHGTIGYRVLGSQPLRKKGTGSIIQDGTAVDRNWQGNIPHEKYAEVVNPERGFIITSNNKVVPDYPYYLNGTYAPRYRYENIRRLIAGKTNLKPEDMMAMQTDTHTVLAEKVKGIMKRLIKPGIDIRMKQVKPGNVAKMKQALELVYQWDNNVTKDSTAASIYNTFYVRFMYHTLKDELGDDLAEQYISERYISMERFFLMVEQGSRFFDDTSTAGKKETPSDIATRAFEDTLKLLEEYTGTADMSQWKWGDMHVIRFDHLLGKSKLLEPLVSYGPFPFEGDGETNNRARFKELKPPYTGYLASAPRMVVKFDPEPHGWMMLITGVNEYFMSPHRTDMIDAWRNHEYFSWDEEKPAYTMTMKPGK